jgi:hypothetical protein
MSGFDQSSTIGNNRMNRIRTSFESLGYALRALRREVLQFRFDYPLDIDLDAGPKDSLRY